ncbi:WG repeat-containing protein [Clostridium peptidivorans]|uniref:WG repeat-containing protein n=1 Tax=Clostridium peptidivorans TaxID=100174 RepID=UPI000BE36884|nr:WG repeat-containing protein [Clostridium peptidivorans]
MWCNCGIFARNRASKLYPVSIKTLNGVKWGYIDNKGDIIIKPQYDYAQDFQDNGLAVVEINGKSGVINESNNFVIEPKYETITGFSEGLAQVVDNGVFKVIDEEGKVLTPKGYSYIGSYSEGRAVFYDKNREGKLLYGYLDTSGGEVIPLKYESASNFKEGKAVVKIRDNQYAMIDLNGNILKIYNYAFVGDLGDGLLAFQESTGGNFGYIDESGKIVIVPQYTGAQAFKEGRAVVNTSEDFKNKYGLIDKKGNFIIKPEYNDVNLLGEGMVAVGKAIDPEKPYIGSKYAIADINGKFLTEFIYNNVSEYKNGLASASDDKSTFFIDRTGNRVKSLPMLSGGGTVSMDENLIKANIDYRVSYLDKTGKVIWKQNTIIPLSDKYKIIEEKFKPNVNYLVYYPQVQGMDNKDVEKEVNKKLKELSQVKNIGSDVQLDYNYTGDFLIEFFKKNLAVLELNDYQYYFGAAHGMPTKQYPHINLVNGRFYELKDLFKPNSDYVKVISDIIGEQIKNDDKYSYLFPGAYKGISANQPFYVDENNLYIYFAPYEIAPFAAGFPTFKIPFSEIMNIINTQGEFWRSFH